MNPEKPQHAPLTQFKVENDELLIGGITVSRLAEQVGRTPFYAYDKAAITQRINMLRDQMPESLSLHYAVKANPFPDLVRHVAGLVDGLDIASVGELHLAIEAGGDPTQMTFAGPGKQDEELEAAIRHRVTLNIESRGELERAIAIGERISQSPRVAIRVNPSFELKSSGMKMGGGPKPFGIDAEEVPNLLKEMAAMPLHFRGLHIFGGSQNLRADSIIETENASFSLARELLSGAEMGVELLNIGGGLGIPYFPGEKPLDLQPIMQNLDVQLAAWHRDYPDCEVSMELGRYLVGEAGVYVCRVIDRKISRGQTFLITDGGLHHHLAASGNFGQVIRKNYPVLNATHVDQGERETVSVVGPLCTPLDILGDKVEMGAAGAGDLIAVLQSGAYGFSASPQQFLSHPPPAQILV